VERGILTISIDTEFAWGSFDRPYRLARWRHEEKSREIIDSLLRLFRRYDISATWALVGHLFLSSCEQRNGVSHPDMRRPRYAWFDGDWFRFDPSSSAERDPLWYAPDVVAQLLAASPRQEIASHSFSHALYGEAGFSADCADDDASACVRAAAPWGVRLRSFVYPRNSVGHTQRLARHGFICYRGVDPTWYRSWPGPLKRIAHFVDDFLGLTPPTVLATRDGNLWNIPGSVMLQGLNGWRRLIPLQNRSSRYVRGLGDAIQRRRIFHLWFHPVNLAVSMHSLLRVLESLLSRAAAERDAGRLDILPMGTIAERLSVTPTTVPAV
jgi:hypothetical protein